MWKYGNRPNRSGQGFESSNTEPMSVIAKILKWETKEMALKQARNVRPDGVNFVADLS